MQKIIDLLYLKLHQALMAAFPELPPDTLLEIVQSKQEKFGHYQFNSPMKLGKILGLPPKEIALKVVNNLKDNALPFSVEIAGPGFINISIASAFLASYVNQMLKDQKLGVDVQQANKRIIIDFSSPNTAKEMHVGHLRSSIIGDCLARLFEFLGYDVLRLNHIGDWGTAFGMLIAYMKEHCKKVLLGEETTDLSHLMAWYKSSKAQFDADESFKKRAQQEVVLLQNHAPESMKAWHIICDISKKAYQEIYDILGIKLIERGESFYNPMLKDTVDDLQKKNMITLSDGAKCVFLEGFQNREGQALPLMVQKSDGGYNYDTTDMAAIRHRVQSERGDRIIYVTDAGQATHFKMIFQAAEKAGYLNLDPHKKARVDHVPFGLVLGPDGKKFKTRSGETEKLIDLITTAIEKADAILTERASEMSEKERKELAKALGIGAIKYADLCSNRLSDYAFSYDRMLRFEGNTAAFIMYSYVRVQGIKRKAHADVETLIATKSIDLQHPSEIRLAMHLAQFSETLGTLAESLFPNLLTDYLFGLAEKFNAFFRDCRVEGANEEGSRLLLAEVTARVLKQGLEILGLQVVDKM